MTGGRKWEAEELPGAHHNWRVIEPGTSNLNWVPGPRIIANHLTEPEARDIAGIDDIKAERDEAIELLRRIMNPDTDDEGQQHTIDLTSADAFLTSIKEQGDG